MISTGRHTQNMEETEDDDWSSDFIINKAIPARENKSEETWILRQKRFLIFLSGVLPTNNFIADFKLNVRIVLPILDILLNIVSSLSRVELSDCV